ncbi:hypothetical protein ISCGN_028353 [Ixodes scapularis]
MKALTHPHLQSRQDCVSGPRRLERLSRFSGQRLHSTRREAASSWASAAVFNEEDLDRRDFASTRLREVLQTHSPAKRLHDSDTVIGPDCSDRETAGACHWDLSTFKETSVGSQTPEAPQKLTKSKAFPQRLAPKVRVVLDPTRSQVRKGSPPSSTQGVEEAMEVNVPSTEGSMETATTVPSCSKAGSVSSEPLKKPAQASQVPAGPSGRGRAQPTRLTDNPRKPGHSGEAVSLKGPEVSTEEKMEEASPASDELLPSGAESLWSSAARPSSLKMLDPIHHLGLRLATGAFRTSPVLSLYADSHQMPLSKRRQYLGLSYTVLQDFV